MLVFPAMAAAQKIETIFANEKFNTVLFFPEKIRQAVAGSADFLFSYNEEHPQYFGLVKARIGSSSNLLVITVDGAVYSYILKYRKNLTRLTYFIPEAESIGTEFSRSLQEKSPKMVGTSTEEQAGQELRRKAAYYHEVSDERIRKRRRRGLSLQLNDMIYYGDEVFMVFEVGNASEIAFEIDYLRVFVVSGNRKRNSSYQKVLKKPVLRYKLPERIAKGDRVKIVYVFPRFVLGSKDRLEIELQEKRGNRMLQLCLRN